MQSIEPGLLNLKRDEIRLNHHNCGVTVEELAAAGARCQNIENNPMQSSRRLPAFDKAA